MYLHRTKQNSDDLSTTSQSTAMIDSPLEAHPMRRTSTVSSITNSNSDGTCTPPPYTSQDAPPAYPSCQTSRPQPQTHSMPFAPGVIVQWNPEVPQSPDDIILVTVRINPHGHRKSFDDPLPERPTPRSFLRRLGSRIAHPYADSENIRAIRMPRREYLRHHKRDSAGNYAGTEPQQDWDDEMLKACYGRYQSTRLNSLYQNAALRI